MFLICFSVVQPHSFENRFRWLQEITHHAPNVPFIYVATKSDLASDEATLSRLKEKKIDIVTEEMVRNAAEKDGASGYVVCSALTQHNLKLVFDKSLDTVFSADTKPRQRSSFLAKVKSFFR